MPIAKNPNGARTDAERRAHNKWEQANRVTLGVRMGKADGEAFRAWCSARGQTVNAALASYVADCLREGADGGAAPAAEIVQAAQPVAEAQPGQVLDGAALESAKVAAAAAGETLPAFVARAVRQAADADARERVREANKRLAYDQGDKDLEEKRKINEFALQFDREQARLTPEGRTVRTWDKLYQQQRGDILRSAAFRDYREIFSLQEIPPRERDARGFPPFDD